MWVRFAKDYKYNEVRYSLTSCFLSLTLWKSFLKNHLLIFGMQNHMGKIKINWATSQVYFGLNVKNVSYYWNRFYLILKGMSVFLRDACWNNAHNLGHLIHFDSQHCSSLDWATFIWWQPMNSKVHNFNSRSVCGEMGTEKPNRPQVARSDIVGSHKLSYSSKV